MISDYLTPSERLDCLKSGALAYAADVDAGAVKTAAGGILDNIVKGTAAGIGAIDKGSLLVATLLGIPIGLGAHALTTAAAGKRFEEEKIRRKIELYRDFAEDLRQGVK